jgi:endonuclease/exonuclease/phosphatase family metal-dependent hydrolase
LKSNYIPWYEEDKESVARSNNETRRKQAEVICKIIRDQTRPDSSYILVGDMNDKPDSEFLEGFSKHPELGLTDAVQNAVEKGVMNHTPYPPDKTVWSHRYKHDTGDYQYHLYDHIWVSPALAGKLTGSYIMRREKVGGDGSDHDPVWIELDV